LTAQGTLLKKHFLVESVAEKAQNKTSVERMLWWKNPCYLVLGVATQTSPKTHYTNLGDFCMAFSSCDG
jgi:hypothetical protein